MIKKFVFVAMVFACGCQPQPQVMPPETHTTVSVDLEALGDDFHMSPPTAAVELEQRQLGKFLWERCLPPYGGSGEKPIMPAKMP